MTITLIILVVLAFRYFTIYPMTFINLLFQTLLSDVDALLYVDTDILFLSPVDKIWSFFSVFNSTQLAAVSTEHDDAAIGWYNRFARHPFYGEMGKLRVTVLRHRTSICLCF